MAGIFNQDLRVLTRLIREVFPLGADFNRLTRKEQCKINQNVKNIFGTENYSKTVKDLEGRSQYLGLSFSSANFRKFDVDYQALMASKAVNSPEKKEGLIYHFSSAVGKIKLQLEEFDENLEFVENCNATIARSINSKLLFSCFLFHIARGAYVNLKDHKGQTQGVCVKKIQALYEIEHEIWCHIVCSVLRHAKQKNCKRRLSEKSINRLFQLQFKNSSVESLPYAEKETALVTDIIFSVLERNNFLSEHFNVFDSRKKRKFKFYVLCPRVELLAGLTGFIPDLVKPQKLTGEEVIIKKVSFGASEFEPSKKFLEAVNIANRTPYMVDEVALTLFQQERQSLHPKTYKLPFPTVYEELRAKELLKQESSSIFETEVEINRQKLVSFEVMLVLANCLIGYTLYYPIKFDFRGRQYPLAKFAASTSGSYRFLVMIKDEYTLNTTGLKEVFKAIYSNTLFREKAGEFLNSESCYGLVKKELYTELLGFLNKHTPSEECCKTNFLYKTLLISKFKSLRSTRFKTSIYVERDQKSSSSVFMAMLLRNTALASKSSLTGSSENIVSFLQSRFRAFFASRISGGETIVLLFEKDRRLLKRALMFLLYGQKSFGRFASFKDYLKKEHNLNLNKSDFEIIKKIVFDFDNFVNANVENFCVQLGKLDRVLEYLIRANKKYVVTSLDGVHISWATFIKHVTKVTTYYDPVKGDRKPIRLRTHQRDRKLDFPATVRACKANVIHSIDSAIIREFTRQFNAAGYNILTIHDCVQYNPNAAKVFEKIVLGIYQDPKILKAFFHSVFIPGRESLQEDLKIEFDILVDELYADSKLKGLSILNYENLYELE